MTNIPGLTGYSQPSCNPPSPYSAVIKSIYRYLLKYNGKVSHFKDNGDNTYAISIQYTLVAPHDPGMNNWIEYRTSVFKLVPNE